MIDREQMIRELDDYCEYAPSCNSCLLESSCTSLMNKYENWTYDATDEEIQAIYDLMCGKEVPTPINENPLHYAKSNNPWACGDAMIEAYGEEAFLHFCMCNAFKYIWRANEKGGTKDLRKAITYLEKIIEIKGEAKP